MKKLLASLLVLTLIISSFAVVSFASDVTVETTVETVKTWHKPMTSFTKASDFVVNNTEKSFGPAWYGSDANFDWYEEDENVRVIRAGGAYTAVRTGFSTPISAVTETNEMYMVIKIQLLPDTNSNTKERFRMSSKDSSVLVFNVAPGKGAIATTDKTDSGKTYFDVPDYYGDGWIDCVARINMTNTDANYDVDVYYNGMKKTSNMHADFTTMAKEGKIIGITLQNGSNSNGLTRIDDTGVYTVNKATLPELTFTRNGNRFEFSNEVMMGDLTNSSDKTLSTILVDSKAIPLSDITFEKGGLAFAINEKYFNRPGSTTISFRNVKDIFGQNIKDYQKRDIVINNVTEGKTVVMPNTSFDASSEISRNKAVNSLLTNWYTNSAAGIWHNDDNTMGIFPKDSVEYNTGAYRVFEKFVGVNSAAENQKLVYKIKMYPGGVLSRLRISGIPAASNNVTSYTISSVGAPMFIGQKDGQLYGYVGNDGGASNHNNLPKTNITDYYDGWVDAVAVIDVDYDKTNAPVTVYFNGEKHTGIMYKDFMTYAKKGLISAVNLQSEHQGADTQNGNNEYTITDSKGNKQIVVGTGETKVDDNMAYTVFTSKLPALSAENDGLDITFSNEVMRADLIKEGTTSKIKVNGNYISINDIVIPMGGLNISIKEDALAWGENTIDLSEVTDIFGLNVTSGATFTYERPVAEVEENVVTGAAYDDGKGENTITTRFFAKLTADIANIAEAGFEITTVIDEVTYAWEIALDTVYETVIANDTKYVTDAGYIITGAIGDVPNDFNGIFNIKAYTKNFEGIKSYIFE